MAPVCTARLATWLKCRVDKDVAELEETLGQVEYWVGCFFLYLGWMFSVGQVKNGFEIFMKEGYCKVYLGCVGEIVLGGNV